MVSSFLADGEAAEGRAVLFLSRIRWHWPSASIASLLSSGNGRTLIRSFRKAADSGTKNDSGLSEFPLGQARLPAYKRR
jgi:hypothetical protein